MMGPDAARYWLAAGGERMSRPFHLRWLLPYICGQRLRWWWAAWLLSWPVAAAGMFAWQAQGMGNDWRSALAATALLLGLPGILGPSVVIPVGVDLPATALTLLGVALVAAGEPWSIGPGLWLVLVASTIRETAPVYAAVWLWSPLPLVCLAAPAVRHLVRRSVTADPLGPKFTEIARHPIRSALAAHRGRWRDGWLMVAPWGVCLAGLYQPSLPLIVALAVAYSLLLVATDTVRLVHHAAGPVMAAAAAQAIPTGWLLLAVVVHVVWFRKPERV